MLCNVWPITDELHCISTLALAPSLNMRQSKLLLAQQKLICMKLLLSLVTFCAYQHCRRISRAHIADLL